MDRLNNITRNGGYPWCAEEIAIIDKFGDYINSLLDSLKLPVGSCVFVQRNQDQNGKLAKSVVYIVPADGTNGHGELFELAADSDVVVADLLAGTATKRAITITTTEVAVEGSQSQSWTYCYNTKTAVLATGTSYTFYDLNDLLRPAVWRNILLNLEALEYESGSSWSYTTAQLYTETYVNLLRTNGHIVEVRLDFRNSTTPYTDAKMRIKINDNTGLAIPEGTIIPLQAMVMSNNSFLLYPCYIQRGSSMAIIHLPKVTIPANADLYITGVITLK